MRKKWISISIITALLSTGALAQNKEPTRYDRALAAGYKAQFICSGLWNGGKSLANIKTDELTGIYSRIAAIVPLLNEEVDETERQVRVRFADDAPPRLAIWNRKTGCTSMPIGFEAVKTGGQVKLAEAFDQRLWPMGDASATATKPPSPTLVEISDKAFDGRSYGPGSKTSAVLIIHQGKIVSERYRSGHDLHTGQRTWSVAKSIAGTLVGHAVQNGMADVHAPNRIPQWQKFADGRAAITIDQLLRMSSGLFSDTAGNRTDPIYMGGTSISERTTSWPLLYAPGSRFRYANNDTMLAILAVRAQYRQNSKLDKSTAGQDDFRPYDFFQKLGMTRTYAETDWQDNYILSSQVWTTARDLGRLGMLYLNNGIWNGEQLIPENWREYVSIPSGPQPKGRNFGYGASFWLMNQSEGIPADTFAGFGNRGQYLVIIPSMDIVIIRRGYDTRTTRFDIEALTKAIVAEFKS